MSSSSTAPPGWRPGPRTPTPPQTVGRTHRSGSAASLSYKHRYGMIDSCFKLVWSHHNKYCIKPKFGY